MARHIIKTKEELRNLVPRWRDKEFVFDVETSGLSFRQDRLLGIALHFNDGNSYYVVIEHTEKNENNEVELRSFIDVNVAAFLLKPLFAQDVLMIAHNAKFDMHFLHKQQIFVQGKLFDTLLAAQLLDENRKNGLKDLSAAYGFGYAKFSDLAQYTEYSAKEILSVPLEDAAEYAMNDVVATYKLHKIFSKQLVEEGVEKVFLEIWMPLLRVLQKMEARGIALDLDKVRQIREEYLKVATVLEESITKVGLAKVAEHYGTVHFDKIPNYYKRNATEEELERAYIDDRGQLVYDVDEFAVPIFTHKQLGKTASFRPRTLTFKPSSSDQMQELIFKWTELEYPPEMPLKEAQSGFSADRDNITTLLFYNYEKAPQYLKDILKYRKAKKFITTYLDRFLADADPNDENSITTSFNQAVGETAKGGTTTGRLSSNSPNLQNIPSRGEVGKQARSMFVARKGYKLIVADYSQMELRMLAHYSQDQVLLDAFEKNQDLHILTGASFAQMTYGELEALVKNEDPKGKELRQLGKTGNFALTYGMGARKFQRFLLVNNDYELHLEETASWIDRYNNMYFMSYDWKTRVWKFVDKHGFVATIEGRKRRLTEYRSNERWRRSRAQRQGVNAIIQGSCGDIICKAMPRIQDALEAFGGSLLLQVHDELVAEVPTEYAELCAHIMSTLMVQDINTKIICPMVAEAHIGDSWGAAKG